MGKWTLVGNGNPLENENKLLRVWSKEWVKYSYDTVIQGRYNFTRGEAYLSVTMAVDATAMRDDISKLLTTTPSAAYTGMFQEWYQPTAGHTASGVGDAYWGATAHVLTPAANTKEIGVAGKVFVENHARNLSAEHPLSYRISLGSRPLYLSEAQLSTSSLSGMNAGYVSQYPDTANYPDIMFPYITYRDAYTTTATASAYFALGPKQGEWRSVSAEVDVPPPARLPGGGYVSNLDCLQHVVNYRAVAGSKCAYDEIRTSMISHPYIPQTVRGMWTFVGTISGYHLE